MGGVCSWVDAEMLHPEYADSAGDNWFASDIQGEVLDEFMASVDFYIAYDAGGPLDNAAVQ